MKRIEAILSERIGLDAGATGPTAIERIVRRRMESLGLSEIQQYHERLLEGAEEFGELLETIVVKETWFFRDAEAFANLARLAVEEWLPLHPAGKLSVLSLPCSSGEEAFSIVMALLDRGMPEDRFQVHAIDISNRALARARRGVYGKNAFRGKDLSFREHHFHRAGDDFVLNRGVRQLVQFTQGNLVATNFTAPNPGYDFIFFRNLLIYLSREAQQQALDKIDRLLSDRGLLFVGPAEQPIVLDRGYESAGFPRAFACAKKAFCRPGPVRKRAEVARRSSTENGQTRSDQSQATSSPSDLEQARNLANAGRLVEAGTLCEEHLRQNQFSAEAYYLLGLVREARGDPRAIECYRKALYLEPNHYETLVQLAVLADQRGDTDGARNFQRRAQRLQSNNSIAS